MDDVFQHEDFKNAKTLVESPKDVHELVKAACSEGLLQIDTCELDELAS
jgi:hypothetical protein